MARMSTTLTLKVIIPLVLAVVLLGAGVYWQQRNTTPTPPQGEADYTIEQEPVGQPLSGPDYMRPIAFATSVDAATHASLNERLAQTQAEITADKQNFNAWVRLGVLYKQGGDYAKAAKVWEFVSVVWPGNVVSSNNLGDLYMNFIKDYTKAEASYKKMIAIQADHIASYVNLYYLYRDLLKNPVKAQAIVEQGLAANPNHPDLLRLRAEGGVQ